MGSVLQSSASVEDRQAMHSRYLEGGRSLNMAPHVVYSEGMCPHVGCDCRMQGIDFRLEDHGRAVHDALVAAWWTDSGFAGRCPKCGGWIHFTVRAKQAISDQEAAALSQLPDDWYAKATVI